MSLRFWAELNGFKYFADFRTEGTKARWIGPGGTDAPDVVQQRIGAALSSMISGAMTNSSYPSGGGPSSVEAGTFDSSANQTEFFNDDIIDWVLTDPQEEREDPGIDPYRPGGVYLLGDGPLECELLYDTLGGFGIQAADESQDISHLVLGREDCDFEIVDEIIEARRGQTLRIYSQEMFIAHVISGLDPFRSHEILMYFKESHPQLRRVADGWVGWVSSGEFGRGAGGSESIGLNSAPKESPLKVLGYQVGITGRPEHVRRSILETAFVRHLPFVGDEQYMAQWGEPSTPARLRKIAESIASHARNNKRKSNPAFEAIEDWEQDLEWLKRSFYKGHMRFPWPSTNP